MSAIPMRQPRAAAPGIDVRRLVRSPRLARILSWGGFVVAWQLLVPIIPSDMIPTPAAVARFMFNELRGDTLAPQTVYEAFGTSLQRLVTGLLLALAVGVPIGLLMGLSKKAEWFLHDFVVVGLAMPSLVWALVAGMWFGFGATAPIMTVLLAAVTFVIINVAEGVRDVPKDLLDMSRAYGRSRLATIRHVVLPSLMPFFFASMRYGIANGWKGLVLAELWSSTNGAGWTIKFWYDAHRASGIVGYALFFIIFTLLVERLFFGRLSRWVFRWRPQPGEVEEVRQRQAATVGDEQPTAAPMEAGERVGGR